MGYIVFNTLMFLLLFYCCHFRAKSIHDAVDSKYLLFATTTATATLTPMGELKGIVTKVEAVTGSHAILLTTDSGDHLDLKVVVT